MNFDPPIRVSIVEDDRDLLKNLTQLIHGAPGFQCVGSYADAESALKPLASSPPDVALVDIKLPGMSGIACAVRVKAAAPKTQVLMLTVIADGEAIFESLRAGASGYLLKGISSDKILEAIRDLHAGGSPMSSQIARKVVQYFQQVDAQGKAAENLSPREREVLNLLAKGFRYKEIAGTLKITVSTVRSHLRSIYEKLHVTSRTEAVAKYLRR